MSIMLLCPLSFDFTIVNLEKALTHKHLIIGFVTNNINNM